MITRWYTVGSSTHGGIPGLFLWAAGDLWGAFGGVSHLRRWCADDLWALRLRGAERFDEAAKLNEAAYQVGLGLPFGDHSFQTER
jgi:hypothetical protein